ncbi:O-acyltransferase like protein-like [Aphomia sociella]
MSCVTVGFENHSRFPRTIPRRLRQLVCSLIANVSHVGTDPVQGDAPAHRLEVRQVVAYLEGQWMKCWPFYQFQSGPRVAEQESRPFPSGEQFFRRPLESMFKQFHNKLLFNGMHAVQVFFIISGFLLAYNLQATSDIRDIEWKMLPKIFLARYWRLTPSYAVMIAFTATWLRHLGSGPLWSKHVMAVSNQCRQYWWSHLLYVNNYINDNGFCAAHTWYSGADTQLFYLGLLIHLFTQKNKRRNLVLGLFIIIGTILPALNVWYLDLHALMTFSPEFARTIVVPDFRRLFILGHNNMICYLCAMYAGYKMYEYQKKGITFAGNKFYKYLYWATLPTVISIAILGSFFYEPTPLWVRMLYQATHRFLIGILTIWIIIGSVMKLDKHYTSFIQWDGWTIPGRLTYAVYLLHMNIVHYIIGERTLPIRFTYFSLMIANFGILVMSYLISIPFYLMIEAPLEPIMKIAMSSSSMQVKRSISVDTSCTTDIQTNEDDLLQENEVAATVNSINALQTEDDKNK